MACHCECLLKRHPREMIFTGCPRGIYRADLLCAGPFINSEPSNLLNETIDGSISCRRSYANIPDNSSETIYRLSTVTETSTRLRERESKFTLHLQRGIARRSCHPRHVTSVITRYRDRTVLKNARASVDRVWAPGAKIFQGRQLV